MRDRAQRSMQKNRANTVDRANPILASKVKRTAHLHLSLFFVSAIFFVGQEGNSFADEIIHVQLGNKDFWIPQYFVDKASLKESVIQGGLLLSAKLPDFTPISLDAVQAEDLHNLVTVHLLIFPKFSGNLNENRRLISEGNNLQRAEPYENMEHYIQLTVKNNVTPKDFFVKRDSSLNIIKFISCSLPESVPYARCNHQFIIDNIAVNLGYNRDYLEHQLEIEDKVRDLLAIFEHEPMHEPQKKGSDSFIDSR